MFNAERTISASVESIFDGNFFDGDQVIIVNDGSYDNSLSVVKQLQIKFPDRIEIIDLVLNKGNETARNEGVSRAQNDYIFNLDADNILVPGSISKLSSYLIENKLDAAAFKHLYYFTKSTTKISYIWAFCEGLVNLADCLCGPIVPIASGNYLFKKSVWLSTGGYKVGAKALDAWFFGYETVALGHSLGVMPSGGYFHRHGHASLWMRDAKRNLISSIAKKLVLSHKDLLSPDDVDYLQANSKFSEKWFENMTQRPIKTIGQDIGKNGDIIRGNILKNLKIDEFEL